MTDTKPDERVVWTVKDGAAYYKVSERHFWQLYKDGLIPGFMLGKSIRFYKDEVIEHFKQQQGEG